MTDSLSAIHRLIDDTASGPATLVDHIYQCPKGEIWELIRDGSGGRLSVRHTSHGSAGSAVSETSVEAFLAVNASGEEHAALRLLLGKMGTA